MILEVETEPSINPADAGTVANQLRSLSFPDRKFAILTEPPRFIQAMINEDDFFVIEYSDGSVRQMFGCEPVTLEEVTKVFLLFLDGGDYRHALPFRPIKP